MALTGEKLRAVVNLLADPLQAHAAANALSKAAEERGLLVSDLIAEALAPSPASPAPVPASTTPPSFSEVNDDDDLRPIGRRINGDLYGLRSFIMRETPAAWLVESPVGGEAWLPKSQCGHRGRDRTGRTILIVPMWLARRKGFY